MPRKPRLIELGILYQTCFSRDSGDTFVKSYDHFSLPSKWGRHEPGNEAIEHLLHVRLDVRVGARWTDGAGMLRGVIQGTFQPSVPNAFVAVSGA